MSFRIPRFGRPRWSCSTPCTQFRSQGGLSIAIGGSGSATRSWRSFRSSRRIRTVFRKNTTFNMARSISLREPTLVPPLSSVRLLSLHRFLFRFAFAGANIFAWIFIFQYFYLVEPSIGFGLARTALLYALSHTVTCLATPYAARLLVSGSRRVCIAAIVIAAASFVVLGASFAGFWGAAYTSAALTVFSIGLGLYRALFLRPSELEVEATHKGRVGMFGELAIALAPLLAGIVIVTTSLGPLPLLYSGSALMLLSAVPLMYLPDLYERFSWGYRETFGHFVEPANRAVVGHAILEGMAGAGLLHFWPLE